MREKTFKLSKEKWDQCELWISEMCQSNPNSSDPNPQRNWKMAVLEYSKKYGTKKRRRSLRKTTKTATAFKQVSKKANIAAEVQNNEIDTPLSSKMKSSK